jgi:LytS/YehU family sensor histidine kinase
MIGHLIRFLRSAVPQSRSGMTTLGTEIESVSAYLELMKIRMGPRLRVTVEIAPGLSEIPFPPLLIQTLVENAIKHGLEPKVGPVTLSVCARTSQSDQSLFIEIQDNGVGLQNLPATQGTGLGLNSVRERLRLLYGPDASLSVAGVPAGGVISTIQVPMNEVSK